MSAQFQFDMSKFEAGLRQYVARFPGGVLEDILNKKMYFILRGAWERTPQVKRPKIEQDLNVIAYKVRRSRKTGKLSRGRAVHGKASIAPVLVNARRKKAGLKGLYGKEMEKAVRRLTGARLRGAGILRRGWLRSLLTFASRAKEGSVAVDGRLPAGRGSPRPAQPGWNALATTTYEVNIDSKGNARIDPRVSQATAASFEAELASMQQYIERKIQEELTR